MENAAGAMDAIPNSRKRNRPSGTLTRSRFQLFLHLNRSVHSPRKEQPYTEPVPFHGNRISCNEMKHHDKELSSHLTKDLRVRRVYSPLQSSASDLIESVDSDCTGRKIADLGFVSSLDVENSDVRIESTESPELRLSCEVRGLVWGNSESPDESSKWLDRKLCDGINSGDCSGKIDDLDGEFLLTAPPDAETCGNSKVNEDEMEREDEVRVKDAGEGFPLKDSQRDDSAPKRKPVLRPRFQGKLFKAPGSVNYRRLFPFLMDTMGDDSGSPKLGFCQKDGGMDGRESLLPLSSQSQDASKQELKTDSCSMGGTNGSKLTSSHCLHESPKCLSESKADATTEFQGIKDVGSALHNDEIKQYSSPMNILDCAKASNHSVCSSQQSAALNKERILTTPDAEMYDNLGVHEDQLESKPRDVHYVKTMDLTRSTQENAIEGFCPKSVTGKDSLRRKSVPGQHLHRKLFKVPGSVSYKRLLPFLTDLSKDDSGTSKLGHQTHHQNDEVDMYAERFQLPLLSQSEKVSIDELMTDSSFMHDPMESNALENNVLVNPSNELSHGNWPKSTPSQDSAKLLVQLDANEAVHEGLSAPSVKENSSSPIYSNENQPETHECCQSLSQSKCLEQFRVPAVSFKRGILKRNPRGCRGLCTCLNCASFRLHAERAFEFSRNQLLDAEEVAHDLMKELSHLRNVLEKSTDTIKNSPVFYGSQVIEACRKAFAAEQLAKDRLSQMNDDLNIHCRTTMLQRPRVTFADHAEEKVIQPGG
ncbi:hypothetical protein VNO77_01283 [Canavalia gladiata]|uniref:Uncharacterized protein n=1 Tax=Canavalia gladiata TaxID=3824 RepID=A0AAN9RA40_CANGL